MPTRESAAVGAPCWIDLASSDAERAKSFYGEVFGWAATDGGEEYGGYVTFTLGGSPVAGMMPNEPGSGYPDGWSTYLEVVDATLAQVVELGGSVVLPAEETTFGRLAQVTDPTGASFRVRAPSAAT